MRQHPLLYIEWCDAFSWSGWAGIEQAREIARTEAWVNKEVGWLLAETKEYILIATSWNHQGGDGNFNGFTKIPKTWIKKRRVLK